jgi:hypothetical protein
VGTSAFNRALLVAVLREIPPERRVPALREIHEALKRHGIPYMNEGPVDPHYLSDYVLGQVLATARGTPTLGLRRRVPRTRCSTGTRSCDAGRRPRAGGNQAGVPCSRRRGQSEITPIRAKDD